jgi:hypothetical protein
MVIPFFELFFEKSVYLNKNPDGNPFKKNFDLEYP